MRRLGVGVLIAGAACGGTSPPDRPITNAAPPEASSICEDTVAHYPPVIEPGLVIDEESFLERTLRENETVLRGCYVTRLKYRPNLAGTVRLELTIGADGKARHVHTFGFDAHVDRCLCEKLTGLVFATLSNSDVKVNYQLHFSPPAM